MNTDIAQSFIALKRTRGYMMMLEDDARKI